MKIITKIEGTENIENLPKQDLLFESDKGLDSNKTDKEDIFTEGSQEVNFRRTDELSGTFLF